MALYAFDGTWREDEDAPEDTTNVVRFRDLYRGRTEYRDGVGTRFSILGKFLGGLFGFGGRSRVEQMYEAVRENYRRGDTVIDIIGFSRGAALAVHFCHILADHGIELDANRTVKPEIRFLGLWDTVASFGLSFDIGSVINFQDINLGWNIASIPDNVRACAHALALDERRETFRPQRYDRVGLDSRITELWFRGVHADIGGGNSNLARNVIALTWMVEQARLAGAQFDDAACATVASKADAGAPIKSNIDPRIDPRRETCPVDRVHPSAKAKALAPGERATFTVNSCEHYNWAAVQLEKGARYRFDVAASECWEDGGTTCGADGWSSASHPFIATHALRGFEPYRRVPEANWFELIGALSNDDEELFRIGSGGPEHDYVAPRDAELFAFANDLSTNYRNNIGAITVGVTRLTEPH